MRLSLSRSSEFVSHTFRNHIAGFIEIARSFRCHSSFKQGGDEGGCITGTGYKPVQYLSLIPTLKVNIRLMTMSLLFPCLL